MDEALLDAELVTYVPPSHVLRDVAKLGRRVVRPDATIVVASKGVERNTLALMTDVIEEELPGRPVVALSGPSFAVEVVTSQPTAVVVASTSMSAAERAQDAFSSTVFRAYTHTDVRGVELGGSLKNVMAVATGIAEGLGLGYNSRAALITRGLAETARLATAQGANPLTLMGLAGLGDLVATCSSPLSRNRTFGERLGQGMTTEEIYASTRQVAEGAKSCKSLLALARRTGVDAPIAEAVDAVVDGKMTALDMMNSFIARDTKPELH
jgi:glycerol-3-phosphate dehydrogenase (NAD(P)+)